MRIQNKKKVKMYFVEIKNKKIIDKTFNKLHDEKKLSWTTDFTSFNFSCFVVWKNSFDQKKRRVVVNIRSLNTITLWNVYFISLQIDIIQIVNESQFISIIDCVEFFYQWKIHLTDRHKLRETLVVHSFAIDVHPLRDRCTSPPHYLYTPRNRHSGCLYRLSFYLYRFKRVKELTSGVNHMCDEKKSSFC